MLLENYRDSKLKVLYQKLTRSDFKGGMDDEYIVTLLYAMRCLDSSMRNYDQIPERHFVDYAKELIRIYETCENEEMNNTSIMAYARAMLKCMKEKQLKYKDIHKMSTWDLINSVNAYVTQI